MTKIRQEPPPTEQARARVLLEHCATLIGASPQRVAQVAQVQLPHLGAEAAAEHLARITRLLVRAVQHMCDFRDGQDARSRWELADPLLVRAYELALDAVHEERP